MRQLYNAGSDIIQAYLHGRRLKDARLDAENEAEARRITAELRQQEIDEKTRQFEKDFAEKQRLNDDKIKANEALRKYREAELKIRGVQALRTGEFETADGKRINVGEALTNPEYFSQLTLPTATEKADRKVAQVGAEETAKRTAAQPFVREGKLLDADIQAQQQLRQQHFLSSEYAKNREAVRQNALLQADTRLKAAAMVKENRTEEKRAAKMEAVDAFAPDIIDGSLALEDIPKGEVGLAIQSNLRGQKIKIITRKERDKIINLKGLQEFYAKAKELNDLLQEGNLADQAVSQKISTIQESLDADLVAFGRSAKEEKGVVSDKDIVRLRGAIPKILPGGIRALMSETERRKANKSRTEAIEKIYFQKVEDVLQGMSPAQRKAIETRFEIMSREEEIPD